MVQIFVIDTVSFINYFNDFFEEERILSKQTISLIDKCLNSDYPDFKLIVPSIVLIEIFEKQLKSDYKSELFRYTILRPLMDNNDVEIKAIEPEVLKAFCEIDDNIIKLENHDKLILSCALQMNVPIITNDGNIVRFLKKSKRIPYLF